MASKLLSLKTFIMQPLRVCINSTQHNHILNKYNFSPNLTNYDFTVVRHTNFFNKLPAENLWKSVISVSNAGAKKGRGRGIRKKGTKDLNRGQIIGQGNIQMVWPGLTSPIIRGRELVQQQRLPDDPERMAKLIKVRDSMVAFRRLRLNPIERGWSGTRISGRSVGPPDAVGEDRFDGFDTKILEFKPLLSMNGNLGRTRRFSALAVTGNGKGLAGFALGKSKEGSAALRKARNRAGQKLMHFELYNGHGIFHDFFTQFGKTKIFVSQRPEGYGLVCHRAIKCICEVVGIKNMHAKVEGSTNLQHIVKAFFLGLIQQKTHKQLSEEKKLHLVEFRSEHENCPKVVASPSQVRTPEQVKEDEVLDFTRYVMHDKVVLKKKKRPAFYKKLPHFQLYLKKYEKRRNHESIRLQLMAQRGELKSFLNDKYPESVQEEAA